MDDETRWEVLITVVDEHGEWVTERTWIGEAADAREARRRAMDAEWDSRLDAASCRAEFYIRRISPGVSNERG